MDKRNGRATGRKNVRAKRAPALRLELFQVWRERKGLERTAKEAVARVREQGLGQHEQRAEHSCEGISRKEALAEEDIRSLRSP